MTTQQKNIEIALMFGAVKENWYPPNKDVGNTGDYYIFPHKGWYPDNKRQHGDYALKFHSDANWQFEALSFIEQLDNGEYATSISHDYCISNYGCDKVEIDFKDNALMGYEDADKPIVFVLTKGKKEAIFEALYQFSQYLKQ